MAEQKQPEGTRKITTNDMQSHFVTMETNGLTKDALPEFYEFEEKDDNVLGVYLGSRIVKSASNNNEFRIHAVDCGDNKLEFVGGAQIDRILEDVGMIHKLIKVTYTGLKDLGSGKKLKQFTVFFAPAPKGWTPDSE